MKETDRERKNCPITGYILSNYPEWCRAKEVDGYKLGDRLRGFEKDCNKVRECREKLGPNPWDNVILPIMS